MTSGLQRGCLSEDCVWFYKAASWAPETLSDTSTNATELGTITGNNAGSVCTSGGKHAAVCLETFPECILLKE